MTAALMMLIIQSMAGGGRVVKEDITPFAALKAEYELIQQKKSKLSANQRRSVVAEHERRLAEREKQ